MPPSYPPRRPGRAVSPHPDGHTPRSTHSGGTDGSGTTTGSANARSTTTGFTTDERTRVGACRAALASGGEVDRLTLAFA